MQEPIAKPDHPGSEGESKYAIALHALPSFNFLPMGCWQGGAITDANDALLQLIGYSKEEILAGKVRWTELTPPRFQPRDERALHEIKSDGSCAAYEKEYIRKDGRHVPILVACAASEIGNPDSGPFIAVDLTQWKNGESLTTSDD